MRPIPGDLTLWIASSSERLLDLSTEDLSQRWEDRGLETLLLTPEHIRLRLDQRYVDWFWASLLEGEGFPGGEALLDTRETGQVSPTEPAPGYLNRDLHPVGLFYGLSYWNALFSPLVARALAARLGFQYLDTGAMYRAIALAGIERGVDWHSPRAGETLAELAETLDIELIDDRVLVDGRDVSREIRAPQVTRATRHVADNPAVRAHLVARQRAIAGRRDVVTEGRDQGTVAFPEADCKFFLTASPEQRARRRLARESRR